MDLCNIFRSLSTARPLTKYNKLFLSLLAFIYFWQKYKISTVAGCWFCLPVYALHLHACINNILSSVSFSAPPPTLKC